MQQIINLNCLELFKKNILLNILFGGLTVLALPPYFLFWVLFFTIPYFMYKIQIANNIKELFATSISYGFGYYFFGIYWIYFNLENYFGSFTIIMPLALIAVSFILAFYFVLMALICYFFRKNDLIYFIIFPISWVLVEWVRANFFLGFAWNFIGYALDINLPLMQLASITGIYGVSFLVILLSSFLWLILNKNIKYYVKAIFLLMISGSIYIIFTFGQDRLEANDTEFHDLQLKLIQTNIDQKVKWTRSKSLEHLDNLVKISEEDNNTDLKLIIWPETALPFYLSDIPEYNKNLFDTFAKPLLLPGQILLAGVIRYEGNVNNNLKLFNSLVAINDLEELIATYDKAHLVPFGEYIPLRNIMPFNASKLIGDLFDLTPGTGPKTIKIANIPSFSPAICYEIIFPHSVVDPSNRPEWLLNITNDGWFAQTSGPMQHYVIAKTRTIEEGLPMIRVANLGITAVIDAYGREISYIDLELYDNEKQYLNVSLPKNIQPTIYGKCGDWLIYLLFFILLIAILKKSYKTTVCA